MERKKETMTLDQFKFIANKVKERGLQIGAMFCFGEPLFDRGLFDKIRYGRSIGILPGYLGLNTNCSLLTPDIYDDILHTCNNITLSFVNTREEFEYLTNLSWELCYSNATNFIKYRDKHKPNFKIQIGCNDVKGHDRNKVEEAFKDYSIGWARDTEIQWGSKIIIGVIDRSIMYNNWTCDSHTGNMQVKPNGDCCFCAYDVLRNETKFANMFEDSWEDIERKFKALWKQPSSFCTRCDFWWNYYEVVDGGWKRGDHISETWKEDYLGLDIKNFWEENHESANIRFLSDYSLSDVWKFLDISDKISPNISVLNVGIGTGRETKELHSIGATVYALDISKKAVDNCTDYISCGFTNSNDLPTNKFDIAVSHLVCQHTTDFDLISQIKDVVKSLKKDGIFVIQYASPIDNEVYVETLQAQKLGTVRRTKEHMERVIGISGGKIIKHVPTRYFNDVEVTDKNCWNGIHVKRS